MSESRKQNAPRTVAPNPPDPLEPKPPETLQKIKWLLLYGRHYKVIILIGVFVVVMTATITAVWNRWWTTGDKPSRAVEILKPSKLPTTDIAPSLPPETTSEKPRPERLFLDTSETPHEILSVLRSTYDYDKRNKLAGSLYVGRWLRHPWTGSVSSLPTKTGDIWSFAMTVDCSDGNRSIESGAYVETRQDASYLRENMRIHITGRIKEVWAIMVNVDEVSFQLIDN